MNKSFLGLITILLTPLFLLANDHYAVQVGVFLNPRLSDFNTIDHLGYLYAEEDEGNTYRVFVGDFDDVREAENIERQLKKSGYLDAFVAVRNTQFGKPVAVIQMATRSFKEDINWEPFLDLGEVYVLSEGNQVKIVTGVYRDLNEAKVDLKRIRMSGFSDAFPKIVNGARLHELGAFELGDYKKALIPIAFDASPSTTRTNNSDDLRSRGQQLEDRNVISYDRSSSERILVEKSPNASAMATNFELPLPRIRTNVKRQSVLDLQKALKSMGTYNSSLDGYYGDGTASGFEQAANSNATFRKYMTLAENTFPTNGTTRTNNLQNALNNLPSNPASSLVALEGDNSPLAKAYSAYWAFQMNGASRGVNDVMNMAIAEAFQRQPRNSAAAYYNVSIDPRSTYAYQDINQIVRHIAELHQIQGDRIYLPCWMMTRHTEEISKSMNRSSMNVYVSQDCNGFFQWETSRVLKSIAEDIGTTRAAQDGAALTRLYLSPTALSQIEAQGLNAWNNLLWQNLSTWQTRDPLHQKIISAMQLAYFQTQVQLEDHFMDKGFSAPQSKSLALAVLKAMVGDHLDRFV
ncbi:MAG: SPOR domain-containing protein [Bacteroidota bacterium]